MKTYKELTNRQKSIFDRIENIFTLTYGVTIKDLIVVLEVMLNKYKRNKIPVIFWDEVDSIDYEKIEKLKLKPLVKKGKGKIIMITNPRGNGKFWDYFQKCKR